jgi:hypothetical protein
MDTGRLRALLKKTFDNRAAELLNRSRNQLRMT